MPRDPFAWDGVVITHTSLNSAQQRFALSPASRPNRAGASRVLRVFCLNANPAFSVRGTTGDVWQGPHADNIGAGVARASRRSKLAVARISRPRSNHQKPGRGTAERLRDPSCRRSSDQASRSLAARLQGGAIRGRLCALLAPLAEHPNTQERAREGVMFGCSDLYH